METIQLIDVATAVDTAVTVLRRDGIILYPTDTLYGLGADALSDEAVDKVYAIKGREPGKPTHCVVADLEMAAEYAYVDATARRIAERFLPGPLTLILRKKDGVGTGIARDIASIGFRVPLSPFCLALARSFGRPITTPSANPAGAQPQRTPAEICTQFGAAADDIDLVIDAGPVVQTRPSTIIDLSTDTPRIIREGAIPSDEILRLIAT